MAAIPARVHNINVISTGSGSIHPEHMYGTKKPALWWVFTSKEWAPIAINVFVIEHDDGLILFDTGIDPRVVSDPTYWKSPITRMFMRKLFRFNVGPTDGLADQLERAGYHAADVTKAVLSHLHFDHVGGIGDIPQADLLTAREAWIHQQDPRAEREAVPSQHLNTASAKWRPFDFVSTTDPQLQPFSEMFDVMGDGSLIALPTPGHLPGSISLLVRRASSPPVLLIGDLTYSEELLQRDQLAGTGDKDLLLDSYAKVRALKAQHPDLVVIAGHDTSAAAKLAAASHTSSSQPG